MCWRDPAWMVVAVTLALTVLGAGMIFLLRFGLGWSAALAMAGAPSVPVVLVSLRTAGAADGCRRPSLGLLLTFAAGAIAYLQNIRLTKGRAAHGLLGFPAPWRPSKRWRAVPSFSIFRAKPAA